MKKIYFLLSFFLVTYAASAQKIRFTDQQNQWVVSEPNLAEPYYYTTVTTYDNDTVLNGNTYVHSKWGWFREDTLARMVYYREKLHLPEHVLYNYNMVPGDSMVHPLEHGSDSVFYLHSIDSVMLNGSYHLVQFFSHNENPGHPSLPNTVIEGIGQIAQFPFLTYFHVDAFIPLSCFKRNGNPVYIPTIKNWYQTDSKTCTLGVSDGPKSQVKVIIAPHPANSASIISLPSPVTGQIRFVNAMGQTVMKRDIKAASSIAVGTLPASGVYFYQIAGESGMVASGKMVYE
jgi:hypothetical protein